METVLSYDQARQIQSEMSTRIHRYKKLEGITDKDAWARANQEVSEVWDIPDVGRQAQRIFRREQIKDQKEKAAAMPALAVSPSFITDSETITELYELWCWQNDSIPEDKPLAHFQKSTTAAFSNARCKLRKDGWGIEKDGNEWVVTQRPEPLPEDQEVEQLKADIATLKEMINELSARMT